MVANVWFDREQDRLAYNIEDSDYQLLSADADVDQKTEIDSMKSTWQGLAVPSPMPMVLQKTNTSQPS